MLRPFVLSLSLVFLFTACQAPEIPEADDAFVLAGQISGEYSDWIYLQYGEIEDSVRVTDGRFSFAGELEEPVHGSLFLAGTSNLTWIYLDKGKIDVQADYRVEGEELNTLQNVVITGSAAQDFYTEMQTRSRALVAADSTGQAVYEYMSHLIDSTNSHPAIGTRIASAAISSQVMTRQQLAALYAQFDTNRMEVQTKQVYALGMANRGGYGVGDQFPDVPIERPDGSLDSLSTFRGMRVYVDFWASWCGPCRQNHPRLRELAAKTAGRGLAFVSISIDQDRDNWVAATEEDGLSWPSYLDVDHRLEEDMAIRSIPKSYLLDEDGTILEVNPPLEDYWQWTTL